MATSNSVIQKPLSFEQIFDIVKQNEKPRFDEVYRTLLVKPEDFTKIPDNESYSILHYLVINGDLDLFNRIIAIPNIHFMLLTQTATKPRKDALQLATDNQTKSSDHKKLYETIDRLVTLDKFVGHGKHKQIQDCRNMLLQDPDLINLKPPYRKFYLIHHLAYENSRDAFDQLRKLGEMEMTLLTNDQQTASEVALEQKHKEFAAYLESLSPEMRNIREQHEQENLKRDAERKKQSEVKLKQDEKIEEQIRKTDGNNMLACFTCPLTKDIFQDPVVLSDGFTYERAAIQQWLDTGHTRSPMTNIELTNVALESLFKNERRIFA
ncbi:unnamed protein product [Rotaria socialis]|uniref:U-box domain-containing protein n=1 Tax=Rotaria socialis TaxID=392032 RepID=A0A820EWJ7_9BILA|nr:unnamed protein product [Rotaria socialis]CAF3492320.1 unnamed protein product [Rotaria socialis]CAF3680267.1 unnamed protein product [Rotaria socialis]CAF3751793.1 unnamed protein product [Rotaria socialis]CAF4217805.1 unnamed protein product [Rotaria socialis]